MSEERIRDARQILGALFDDRLLERAEESSALFRSWRGMVGERLAAHSRIVELERGLLLVEADHPSWIQLLQFRQGEILSHLRRDYPQLQVRGLAFRVKNGPGLKAPAPQEGLGHGIDDQNEDAAEGTNLNANGGNGTSAGDISTIKDDGLRSALEKLRKTLAK